MRIVIGIRLPGNIRSTDEVREFLDEACNAGMEVDVPDEVYAIPRIKKLIDQRYKHSETDSMPRKR